ncbi:DUF6878 family protein [Streptococcus uberis]
MKTKNRTMKTKNRTVNLVLEARLALLRAIVKERGITSIYVDFNGSGDSGSMDHVCFDVAEGREAVLYDDLDAELVLWVEKVADQAVEATGLDWYNNEGGYGKVVFNPTDGSVEVEMNQAVLTHDTSTHEYGIDNLMEDK